VIYCSVKCRDAHAFGQAELCAEFLDQPSSIAGMSEGAAAASRHTDMRQCRICLGGPDEELGRLIKPCLCKGSIKVRSDPTWHIMIAHV
jgi:RING-variant domain